MEFLHTMRSISALVSDRLSKRLVHECCKNADISFDDFVAKARNLEGHFPKFEEIYQMSTTPTLWSDVFSVECKMLCNRLLLNTNIDITKIMSAHIARTSMDPFYAKKMELLTHFHRLSQDEMYHNELYTSENLNSENTFDDSDLAGSDNDHAYRLSASHASLGFMDGNTDLSEGFLKNRNSVGSNRSKSSSKGSQNRHLSTSNGPDGLYKPEALSHASLFSIISNLAVYNERMNSTCLEDRQFYEKTCKRLFYLSEEDLLNRPDFVKRGRSKVLQFLKQLSRTLDIDKCTHNLAVLFFDCYLHQITTGSNGVSKGSGCSGSTGHYRVDNGPLSPVDYSPFTDSELLKIATACYLLASALREHWVDISKDKYLEHAVEMSYNAFTTKEVIAVQLDVLHRMPKGFTSIYTCMEYGLFFLANIKYINFDLNVPAHCSSELRTKYFDDFLFLASAFNFLVQTGALCWVYHCLSKWDDLYVAKNWNRFIPPSRSAAVLIFHFFVTLFNVDFEKDVLWCRRFCYRVFRMFYDSDVALWYFVFRENIRSFLQCIEKSSDRMHKMSSLFALSANVFRSAEALVCLYHAKVLVGCFLEDTDPAFHVRDCFEKIAGSDPTQYPPVGAGSSLLGGSAGKAEHFGKGRKVELDGPGARGRDLDNKLWGLDYENMSLLFSNLIDVLQHS